MWPPTVPLSTLACRHDMAATYTLSVEGDRPLSGRVCRNSRTVNTEQCSGSVFRPIHQTENSFHLLSYCRRVDGALAFSTVRLTGSVQLLSSGSDLPTSKRTVGGCGVHRRGAVEQFPLSKWKTVHPPLQGLSDSKPSGTTTETDVSSPMRCRNMTRGNRRPSWN